MNEAGQNKALRSSGLHGKLLAGELNISLAMYRERWQKNEKQVRQWADKLLMRYHEENTVSLSVAEDCQPTATRFARPLGDAVLAGSRAAAARLARSWRVTGRMFVSHATDDANLVLPVLLEPCEWKSVHPSPISSATEPISDEAEFEQQGVALSLFSRTARNLEQFNNTACPRTPDADRELQKHLSWTSTTLAGAQCFSRTLLIKYGESSMYEGFRKLAVLHRRGDDQSLKLNDRGKWSLWSMFAFALVAALLTHLFSEWHPAGEVSHEAPSLRPWLGLCGMVLAFVGVLWFWWRRPLRDAERAHDYRALAEGMRVQLFWNLVGLGESVSANYMQRQRGELDWIRGAIVAASIPIESWQDRFDSLDKPDQVTAVRCVLQNWAQEQATYFARSVDTHRRRLHFWHKLGGLAALTGLLGFVLLVSFSFFLPHNPLEWL